MQQQIQAIGLGFLLFFVPLLLHAQSWPEGLWLRGSALLGRHIKHREIIQLPLGSYRPWAAELAFEYQSWGARAWEEEAKYPRLGLALSHYELGNPNLGRAWGAVPYVALDFLRRERFRCGASIGFGIGYVTETFSLNSNPDNLLIGRHWNNQTIFRFQAEFALSEQFWLASLLTFNHYSNGSSQFPNLGLNTISFGLGLAYSPKKQPPNRKLDSLPPYHKGLLYGLYAQWGPRASSTTGGPKFSTWLLGAELGYSLNRRHSLKLGFEYEYLGSSAAFENSFLLEEEEARARGAAQRLLYYIGDEWRIGRLSFSGHLGSYLLGLGQAPFFLHSRIALRYYLRPQRKRISPYLTASLKAHQITAEYFGFGLGFVFH